jgi:hypothetical protein
MVNGAEGFDFLEIRYEDIAFLKKGLLYQKLCILSNGKRYKSFLDRDVYQSMLPIFKEKNIRIKRGWFVSGKMKNPKPRS